MELTEVLKLEGVKLIDTNVLHRISNPSGRDFLVRLGSATCLEEVDLTSVQEETDYLIRTRDLVLSRSDTFFIPEIVLELQNFLQCLNTNLNYYQKNSRKRRRSPRRGLTKNHKRPDPYKQELSVENSSNGAFQSLNTLCLEVITTISAIRKRDITSRFNETEKKDYNQFYKYFEYIALRESLKRVSLKKEFRSKDISDYHTDEKLVSAAFALAPPQRVLIVSCDSDILRMVSFFENDHTYHALFRIPARLGKQVYVFSNFDAQGFIETAHTY
jgi:hypothetical protein